MVNIFPDPSKLNDHENTNKIVLVIFIKIAKPKVKEELKISLLNKKLKIINWFDCHYTNIGKEDYWSDVLIVEFKDKFELEKYYKNGVGKIFYEKKELLKKKILNVSLKPGQAIFFSGRILHRSGNNTSKLTRFSMVGLYHDIDDQYFIPPSAKYSYRKETPKQYYDSLSNYL